MKLYERVEVKLLAFLTSVTDRYEQSGSCFALSTWKPIGWDAGLGVVSLSGI
jgi:hypothetical protein